MTNLLFCYLIKVVKLLFPYAISIGSVAGDDAGNEQPNSMVVNEVGESIVSLAGVMTESDGQKVCFVHSSGILHVILW